MIYAFAALAAASTFVAWLLVRAKRDYEANAVMRTIPRG